eukprot:270288-Pelagomonas_calceolata.AAC.1
MQHIQMSTMGHQEDSDVELELSSDDDGECTLCTPNAQHPIANRPSSSAAPPTLFQQHSQSMHPDYEVPAGGHIGCEGIVLSACALHTLVMRLFLSASQHSAKHSSTANIKSPPNRS